MYTAIFTTFIDLFHICVCVEGGGIRSSVVVRWTAGQPAGRAIVPAPCV